MAFTALEKLKEVEREVQMREYVYTRHGLPMTAIQACQLALMRAIAEDYAKLAESERLL